MWLSQVCAQVFARFTRCALLGGPGMPGVNMHMHVCVCTCVHLACPCACPTLLHTWIALNHSPTLNFFFSLYMLLIKNSNTKVFPLILIQMIPDVISKCSCFRFIIFNKIV